MLNAKTVRQNARKKLNEWMKDAIKRDVAANYKFARRFGIKAVDAISLARYVVEQQWNAVAKANFEGPTHLLK